MEPKRVINILKRVDKEYVLLFLVIILVGFLIYTSSSMSQAPEYITVASFYPCPFGEYDVIGARILRDYDDPLNYYVDPSGESRLNSLIVDLAIRTTVLRGPGTSVYSINFNDGNARINNLLVDDKIHMGAVSAPGGKYVYDVAEGMSALDCEAGDVVLISDEADHLLVKSSKKFDPAVAGVISENPKLYLGQGQGKMPLALAGIVKCKVTTENGAITRGDLLVSSSLSGHAMRAKPEEVTPGMVIGKALEKLETGSGKIHILVNKQ